MRDKVDENIPHHQDDEIVRDSVDEIIPQVFPPVDGGTGRMMQMRDNRDDNGEGQMKNWMRTQKWIRATSIIVLALFVCTQSAFANSPKVYTVKLPKEACDVKERWKGESNKTVIHIQDAHNNVDAQMNIARIIGNLVEEKQVEMVGVEGADAEVDLDDLRSFSTDIKEIVSDWYIEDGIMSGAEKSLITTPHSFDLIGVEDKELFRKNFRAFYGTQLKREDIITQIEEIENILNDLKTPIYGSDLMTFDNVVTLWESGKSDLVHFLQELDQFVINNGVDVLNYIHYASFREVLVLKSHVMENTLTSEKETISILLDEAFAKVETPELIALRDKYNGVKADFASQAISEREFIDFLSYFAEKVSVDFKTFPQLNGQLKYLQSFSRLDMNALMNDVKQLTHDVRLKLAKTEDERQLVTHARHIRMLKDLTALTAVNNEVTYFKGNIDQFRYNTFAAFINEKSAKYSTSHNLAPDGIDIDKMLTYVAHFYKGAELRNTVLVENLIRLMDKNGEREAALVSGGYHTEGIVAELKKRGISYMVVTPKIDNPEPNAAYAQKMMGQLVPLSPQLVGNINKLVVKDIEGQIGTVMSGVDIVSKSLKEKYRNDTKNKITESIFETILTMLSLGKGNRAYGSYDEMSADVLGYQGAEPINLFFDKSMNEGDNSVEMVIAQLKSARDTAKGKVTIEDQAEPNDEKFNENINLDRTVLIVPNKEVADTYERYFKEKDAEKKPLIFTIDVGKDSNRALLHTLSLVLMDYVINNDIEQLKLFFNTDLNKGLTLNEDLFKKIEGIRNTARLSETSA